MSTAKEIRQQVLEAAKAMYAKGLVEGTAGNVSGRIDEGTVAMTPSSLGYDVMTLDDIVTVDLEGTVVEGERSATSEKGVHLACFAAYPEVQGVVHCHAKYASMFQLTNDPTFACEPPVHSTQSCVAVTQLPPPDAARWKTVNDGSHSVVMLCTDPPSASYICTNPTFVAFGFTASPAPA